MRSIVTIFCIVLLSGCCVHVGSFDSNVKSWVPIGTPVDGAWEKMERKGFRVRRLQRMEPDETGQTREHLGCVHDCSMPLLLMEFRRVAVLNIESEKVVSIWTLQGGVEP